MARNEVPSRPEVDPPPSLFERAALGLNPGRPPLWIMRQAGRYLPEYQKLRESHSFVELCTQSELSFEVSLQPWRRFGFDAVIVFYDILFLAESMGAPLEFADAGPVFRRPIRSADDVERLHPPDLESVDPRRGLGAISETLRRLRAELPRETAVLGFAGAPFTVAAYLLEGGFHRAGERIHRAIHEEPVWVHRLLERLASATADYLLAQVQAGATAVQLFDTSAGLLPRDAYREFALPYAKRALEKAALAGVPTILYVNGCSHLLEDMRESGARVLGVDWRIDLAEARSRVPSLALQGNLDPSALFLPPEELRTRARAMLEGLRGDPGYIANLGHGILPETPLASVQALVDAVRDSGG